MKKVDLAALALAALATSCNRAPPPLPAPIASASLAAPTTAASAPAGVASAAARPAPRAKLVELVRDGGVIGGLVSFEGALYFHSMLASGGAIERVPLKGGEVETLYIGAEGPAGFAIADHAVFWLDVDNDCVWRVPLRGRAQKRVKVADASSSDVSIAALGDDVYFTANDALSRVHRGRASTIARGVGPVALFVHAGALFGADPGSGEVSRFDPITGARTKLAAPRDVFAAEDHLEIAAGGASLVLRPKGGGAPVTLAVAGAPIADSTDDGVYAYFAFGAVEDRSLARVPLRGGAVEILAEHQPSAHDLLDGGDRVYFVRDANSCNDSSRTCFALGGSTLMALVKP